MRSWFSLLQHPEGRSWLLTLAAGILIVLLSFVLLVWAGHYLNLNFRNLPPLPDLGHEVLPKLDVLFLFKIGLLTSLVLFLVGAVNEPHRLPYILFMAGLWFLVRIVCMVVTPLGIPQGILLHDSFHLGIKSIWDIIQNSLDAPNVLFFSGHTGLPFLGYLLFRKPAKVGYLVWPMLLISAVYIFNSSVYPWWVGLAQLLAWAFIYWKRTQAVSLRDLFLGWSLVMAGVVLLIRVHYTIDVIGAYFMTAGIVFLGRYCFLKLEKLCDRVGESTKTED